MSNEPKGEPYGQVTTHSRTGQQFFYRWPEAPYLDNASECVTVYTHPQGVGEQDTPAPEPVAWRDVIAERKRQVEVEGWTHGHDDTEHGASGLAAAAGCYALFADAYPNAGEPPSEWPWEPQWWKPKDFRRDMVRAAALLLAAIEWGDRTPAPALTGAQIKQLASRFDIDGSADEILDFARAILRTSPSSQRRPQDDEAFDGEDQDAP